MIYYTINYAKKINYRTKKKEQNTFRNINPFYSTFTISIMPGLKEFKYEQVKDEKDADAAAWVFASKSKFEKIFFKFPVMMPDEVRARVLYTSLCPIDSLMGRGEWRNQQYPKCTGHEIIALITNIGSEVENVKSGDVVGFGPFIRSCGECKFCEQGWNHACENIEFDDRFIHAKRFGGYATHVQLPAQCCVKIPENLDISKASPLLCAGVTSYAVMSLYVKPDDRVALIGIGGLGHLAVQMAKKMAREVHAITHTAEKIDAIKHLGADKVLTWDEFHKENPHNVYDAMIICIPKWPKKDIVKSWIDSLAPYGRLIVLGIMPDSESGDIDLNWLKVKSNLLISSFAGGMKHTEDVLKFCADNHIECQCEFMDFNEFDKALKKQEKSKARFRIVVKTEEYAKKLEALHA